ncbi:tetratricopeptide repeat-containing sulfotransferase family protein [Arenimonas daejeonensis]|uniref:tetratricopeptide repeat-containing sulfotransferase family protein n=1 Tax=Arenimonas daejeonensis TaxID=370777 RepID=UPI0011BE4B76|nr:tetratricopeptide repeat-containing sulfotransferase family protein [Arenimonas daejeonensis]
MTNPSLPRWQRAEALLAARQLEPARDLYLELLADPDWILPARLRLGAIALETAQLRAAVDHALAAFDTREPDPVLLEALCRLLLNVGELRHALACVDDPSIATCTDAAVLAGLGRMMADQGVPERAIALLRRARSLGADSADLHYQLGYAESYAGHDDAAETELEACLARAPDHAPAFRTLAKLRRATPARNHVDRLRAAIARVPEQHPDTPLLHYALFKELDDLGDTAAAWPALETGMRLRRLQLRYDPAADAALFEQLMQVRATATPPPVEPGPVPIFIVGMPRSGTTLLERIVGGHPDVTDAGELRDFTVQLRWCTEVFGGPQPDAALARAAARTDLSTLGRRYLDHTQWHAQGRAFYTDKMPANFLNVGYLANVLPQARFLHLVRDPMDVCFSNLKELFGDAYPHSYDQGEMAAHFLRYRKLMAHWHTQFPGRLLDVAYDALVSDPETTAHAVLAHCGLPPPSACPPSNPAPAPSPPPAPPRSANPSTAASSANGAATNPTCSP